MRQQRHEVHALDGQQEEWNPDEVRQHDSSEGTYKACEPARISGSSSEPLQIQVSYSPSPTANLGSSSAQLSETARPTLQSLSDLGGGHYYRGGMSPTGNESSHVSHILTPASLRNTIPLTPSTSSSNALSSLPNLTSKGSSGVVMPQVCPTSDVSLQCLPGYTDVPKAADLLLLFSFLDGSEIPMAVLIRMRFPQKRWNDCGEMEEVTALKAGLDPDLVAFLSDDIMLDQAIQVLRSHSLIVVNSGPDDQSTFVLKDEVKRWVVQRSTPSQKDHWSAQASKLVLQAFPRGEQLDRS